jgi:hypothetical protein
LMPSQTSPTIGDRLTERSISWAWYAQGWDDALAGHPDPTFAFHHQPFVYFANYADGSKAKAAHLKDERDFLHTLTTNRLPAVSFIVPLDSDSEHPGLGSALKGQEHVARLVKAVRTSPYWADSAIVITYDENGGRWDHVPPPVVDRWGPGSAFQPSSSPRMPRGGSWITRDTTRHRSSSSSRHGGTWRLWARAMPPPMISPTPSTFHRSPRENDDPRALASQPTCHQL